MIAWPQIADVVRQRVGADGSGWQIRGDRPGRQQLRRRPARRASIDVELHGSLAIRIGVEKNRRLRAPPGDARDGLRLTGFPNFSANAPMVAPAVVLVTPSVTVTPLVLMNVTCSQS